MSYNSYVILDDKIAVMDTVDANFTHEWLDLSLIHIYISSKKMNEYRMQLFLLNKPVIIKGKLHKRFPV